VHYLERVGLDHVKKIVLEDEERRKELYQRLLFALEGESDPWHEPEKAQVDTRQFEMLSAS
jgi:nitrite reductase (NADH) large subunit